MYTRCDTSKLIKPLHNPIIALVIVGTVIVISLLCHLTNLILHCIRSWLPVKRSLTFPRTIAVDLWHHLVQPYVTRARVYVCIYIRMYEERTYPTWRNDTRLNLRRGEFVSSRISSLSLINDTHPGWIFLRRETTRRGVIGVSSMATVINI